MATAETLKELEAYLVNRSRTAKNGSARDEFGWAAGSVADALWCFNEAMAFEYGKKRIKVN